jgi:hypothetical protein
MRQVVIGNSLKMDLRCPEEMVIVVDEVEEPGGEGMGTVVEGVETGVEVILVTEGVKEGI